MRKILILGLLLLILVGIGCVEETKTEKPQQTTPTPQITLSPTTVAPKTLAPTTPPVKTPPPAPSTSLNLSATTKPTLYSPETIERIYEWTYNGKKWKWDLRLPKSLYGYYKSKPRPPTLGDYSIYVTDPYDDVYLDALVKKLVDAASQSGYSEYERVNFVIAFVQSLPYTSDNVTTPYDEYPRYPIETLVDNGGDCEDTAILTAALLNRMKYDVVLIGLPKHMAAGVLGGEGIYGTYFSEDGKKYFYLETTGRDWKIGQIPDQYKNSKAILYHLVPRPILTHSWNASYKNNILALTVMVENVGTAAANSVKVSAAFDAGGGYVYNPKESNTFVMGAGSKATVTLYLDMPRDKYTSLIVRIINENYLMDESKSKWFQT